MDRRRETPRATGPFGYGCLAAILIVAVASVALAVVFLWDVKLPG